MPTTLDANNRILWLVEKGLRFFSQCECGYSGNREYPEWECGGCGASLPSESRPANLEAQAEYDAYLVFRDAESEDFHAAGTRVSRTGGGEWANGHDMFQLPRQGDPERRTAYSLRDFEQKLRKTNLNEDGVTTWDKQPPRFLNPDEKSPW